MAPMFLRPSTTPTPIMWPTTPHANVSARVKPAGSPVCRPESLASSFRPAVAFRFADGANPNRPANNIRLVEVTIICISKPLKFNFDMKLCENYEINVKKKNCYQISGWANEVTASSQSSLPSTPHGLNSYLKRNIYTLAFRIELC